MSNIGKRSAMNECRHMLQCLHQIWLQRIFHKCRHRTFRMDIPCTNRLIIISVANNNAGKGLLHIFYGRCKTKNSHDFGCNSNIKAAFPGNAIHMSPQTDNDMPERTVIHIHNTVPDHTARINLKLIPLLDMIIRHGCKKIVSRRNGVEISRKMKINIFHRHYLGISASRRTALNAHTRPEGRFPKTNHDFLIKLCQRLSQTYGCRCFSFSRRCGGNSRHQN